MSAASSYASGVCEVPLLGDTIGENLDRTVRRFPGRDALVDVAAGRSWTYAELAADVDALALALGLLDLGIVKGDRVGIWAPNRAERTLVQYATALRGHDRGSAAALPGAGVRGPGHCFGMVMGNLACTSHGAAMVIPAPSFDPAATLAAVEAESCTSLYGAPTMFIAELADPGFDAYDLSSLRTGIMAGSPCPVEVMKEVIDRMGMTGVSICYGMTETSPVSTQTRADDSVERRVSTVGRAGPRRAAPRSEGGRSALRPDGAARGSGRTVHPRLLGHARLPGRSRSGPPKPWTRPAGCTPATWPSWTPTVT